MHPPNVAAALMRRPFCRFPAHLRRIFAAFVALPVNPQYRAEFL
jgi:hypothetical protein